MDFVFSAGEQQFFCQRNLSNTPKRCPGCRLALRFARLGRDASQLSDVACAECEKPTKVPFKPRGHRPIYCNDCMASKRLTADLVESENCQLEQAAAESIMIHSGRSAHGDLAMAQAGN
jgi:CxxC-x17-CxxC domain-containing protein